MSSISLPQAARLRLPPLNRSQRALVFGLVALLALAPLLVMVLDSAPALQTWTVGEAQLRFEASHSRVIFPGQCVTLRWSVAGIQTIQINGTGVVGEGEQTVCSTATMPYTLRAELRDGSIYEVILPIQRLYRDPLIVALLVTGLVALALAAYTLVGVVGGYAVLSTALVWPALIYYIFTRNLPFSDYRGHMRIVEGVMAGTRSLPPHFTYHTALIGLRELGLTPQGAEFAIALAVHGAVCVSVYGLVRVATGLRADANWRTLALFLALPLVLLIGPVKSGAAFELISAYVYPNTPHNPTVNLLKPFAVALFAGLVALLRPDQTRRGWIVAGMAALTVLATVAKPSYTLPLLAGVGLLFVYALVQRFKGAACCAPTTGLLGVKPWELLLGILLPGVLVLGWQYLYTYGPQQAQLYLRGDDPAGIMLAPLELYVNQWQIPARNLLPQLAVSIIFPAAVYALYFRTAWRDVMLNVAWVVFMVGQAMAYLFVEAPALADGNMTWSGRITLFVLFAATMAFLVRQNRSVFERGVPRDPRFYLSVLLLGLHLLPNLRALFL